MLSLFQTRNPPFCPFDNRKIAPATVFRPKPPANEFASVITLFTMSNSPSLFRQQNHQ
jgi:hypothetical protein